MKEVVIYLNNKLITCDTILPLAIEIKKKNPSIAFSFILFSKESFMHFKMQPYLYKAMINIGKIYVLGGLKYSEIKIIRFSTKTINLLTLIFKIIFKSVISIHFKSLESFPYNLIYYFNKKNTYLMETNSWGYSPIMQEVFNRYYNIKELSFKYYENYENLIYFGAHWPQISHAKNKNKKSFKISSTRCFKSWINTLDCNPNYNEILPIKKQKKILFILGTLDKAHIYGANFSGADLLEETISIILSNSDYKITLKPHAITDLDKLNDITRKFSSKNISINHDHVYKLALIHIITISNYASLALADAWISGSNIVEYSIYDDSMLKITNNNSMFYQYVDFFINKDKNALISLLKKIHSRKKRNIDYNYNDETLSLIEKLSE